MTIDDVIAAEDARCAAMVACDLLTLQRLFADDLIWIHSSGMMEDKAAFLARIGAGADRYLAIRRSEELVRIHGATAIVGGIAEIDAIASGTPKTLRNRFTNVWHFENGQPRLLSAQSTKLV
jgi:ketosteroid isomerase-like protein